MPKKAGRRRAGSPLPSDLEDEVDKFHKKRDVLSLTVQDDQASESDGDLEGEAVMDMSDEEDSEYDSEDEIEEDAHLGRLAKQAKALEAKLRIARGDADDDDDEKDEDVDDGVLPGGTGWGSSKRSYYDADVADIEGSDEEDALQDEEAEAVRLQRLLAAALRPEDFGQESEGGEESNDEEEGSGEEGTLGAAAAGRAVEAIPRELGALDHEARAAAVRQDALELSALVQELRSAVGEVRGRLGPLLAEIRSGDVATSEGVSYLEAKHTLLLHYAASIVFYLLLKAEGRPVRDHPVVQRLVEVRTYLEKIRPIDKRLHYQVEKLLAAARRTQHDGPAAAAGDAEDGDALRYAPRPEALVSPAKGAKGASGGGLDAEQAGAYRPPRLNPVSMELDERGGGGSARERRAALQSTRRAARSTLVAELAAEVAGAPEEHRTGAPLGVDTAAALRDRHRMASREAVEEELMVRVPLSKEERKRMKAQRRAGLSGKALLDDFADDVAELVAGGGRGVAEPWAGFGAHLAGQKFGADLTAQAAAAARRAPRSGDADLPQRESLAERRSKTDGARALHALAHDGGGDNDGAVGGKRRHAGGEEDDFYREAAAAAAGKKQRKRETYSAPDMAPPAADPSAPGARGINAAIEKNRGLTPHRRKDMKNPRKKHRVKFAEATVRRKGQVQAVRQGEASAYGGEGTGIKSRLSKSVKF